MGRFFEVRFSLFGDAVGLPRRFVGPCFEVVLALIAYGPRLDCFASRFDRLGLDSPHLIAF